MKNVVLLLLVWLVASCSSTAPTPQLGLTGSQQGTEAPTSFTAPLAVARSGAEVAAELERRYRDIRDNCGSASKPAFLCTGLILRGTEASTSFDAWNPSPTSVKNDGVSFSFLRSDYKMKRLAYAYDSGFIFYPILSTPPGKLHIEILCFFPRDGDSNRRPNGGCGAHTSYPNVSQSCEEQVPIIDTAQKWRVHYLKYPAGAARYNSSCSFNVRDSANNAAASRFLEGLRAGRLISPDAFNTPNDLKLKTWAQNIPRQLPMEAFFYTTSGGLARAQFYQRRFRALTEETLPIIYIALPQTLEQPATFTYREADQTR